MVLSPHDEEVKILTCTKKFKIIANVLVAEVWCINFFSFCCCCCYYFFAVFSLYYVLYYGHLQVQHQFTLGFQRCYHFQLYTALIFFFAFDPSSGLVTVFLVGGRLILKTPPVI